ncbi:unnamed protein product [Polarella glacialis]|uniref:Secreted protein n=1 Tax=Polarella glacialis TaxID=89957 RepID=A0A813LUV1_POLGL|nr:unnamed protein product [Polarella glacialis]CAE8733617.1 unnamed protein product [Polarella glacialis]
MFVCVCVLAYCRYCCCFSHACLLACLLACFLVSFCCSCWLCLFLAVLSQCLLAPRSKHRPKSGEPRLQSFPSLVRAGVFKKWMQCQRWYNTSTAPYFPYLVA